jgi:hypothetical protein
MSEEQMKHVRHEVNKIIKSIFINSFLFIGKYRYQNAQGHMKKAGTSLKTRGQTGHPLQEFLVRGNVQRGRQSTYCKSSCFGYMYER